MAALTRKPNAKLMQAMRQPARQINNHSQGNMKRVPIAQRQPGGGMFMPQTGGGLQQPQMPQTGGGLQGNPFGGGFNYQPIPQGGGQGGGMGYQPIDPQQQSMSPQDFQKMSPMPQGQQYQGFQMPSQQQMQSMPLWRK